MKENIFTKLLGVKKKVPYIKKDAAGFHYKYADPESVLSTLNPLLNEAGLFLQTQVVDKQIERVKVSDKNGEHEENLFILDILFTWIDVESGDKLESKWVSSGVNGDEKGLGSALTYAERYFLLKTFNIATGEDDPDARQGDKVSVSVVKKGTTPSMNAYAKAVEAIRKSKTIGELVKVGERVDKSTTLTISQKDTLDKLIGQGITALEGTANQGHVS